MSIPYDPTTAVGERYNPQTGRLEFTTQNPDFVYWGPTDTVYYKGVPITKEQYAAAARGVMPNAPAPSGSPNTGQSPGNLGSFGGIPGVPWQPVPGAPPGPGGMTQVQTPTGTRGYAGASITVNPMQFVTNGYFDRAAAEQWLRSQGVVADPFFRAGDPYLFDVEGTYGLRGNIGYALDELQKAAKGGVTSATLTPYLSQGQLSYRFDIPNNQQYLADAWAGRNPFGGPNPYGTPSAYPPPPPPQPSPPSPPQPGTSHDTVIQPPAPAPPPASLSGTDAIFTVIQALAGLLGQPTSPPEVSRALAEVLAATAAGNQPIQQEQAPIEIMLPPALVGRGPARTQLDPSDPVYRWLFGLFAGYPGMGASASTMGDMGFGQP
jgi:hypothetical protein